MCGWVDQMSLGPCPPDALVALPEQLVQRLPLHLTLGSPPSLVPEVRAPQPSCTFLPLPSAPLTLPLSSSTRQMLMCKAEAGLMWGPFLFSTCPCLSGHPPPHTHTPLVEKGAPSAPSLPRRPAPAPPVCSFSGRMVVAASSPSFVWRSQTPL